VIKKILVVLSLCIAALIWCIPNVSASTLYVAEQKAWGYEYKYVITKESTASTWEVGYQGTVSTIKETKENRAALDRFVKAVDDISYTFLAVILWASYLLIIVIVGLIIYKKNKKMWKEGWVILVIFSCIASYLTFSAYVDLDIALNDAKVSYYVLMNP
jgi:hypothetical protein